MVVAQIRIPPMVGVPSFFSWSLLKYGVEPSALIFFPSLCLNKKFVRSGVKLIATMNEIVARVKILIKAAVVGILMFRVLGICPKIIP